MNSQETREIGRISSLKFESISFNIIYEIWKYLTFSEMNHARLWNKKLMILFKDAMVILAEREANRVLLSSDNSTRSMFVEKELPKHVITNSTWFDFLIEQIKKRRRIKAKLFKLIPKIFKNCEQEFNVKLTNFMFVEIKKKRMMNISITKKGREVHSFTDFQELLFRHSLGEITRKYDAILINEDMGSIISYNSIELIQEIIDKNEIDILKDFRCYKNNQNADAQVPKSKILCFLFLVDQFLQSHWQIIGKSIHSKCSIDSFLDEYNARWYSYTYLIQIFEVEMHEFANIVNEACKHPLLSTKFEEHEMSQYPRFSIMRMMWRSWAKYVMRKVFSLFKEKITSLINEYQDKIWKLLSEYEEIKLSKSYFESFIQSEFSLSKVNFEIIRNSLLWILDCK